MRYMKDGGMRKDIDAFNQALDRDFMAKYVKRALKSDTPKD